MYKWLAGALFIAIITTGCSTVARKETSPSPQSDTRIQAQQTAPWKNEAKNPEEIALHLEQLAKGIKGVQNAHCVVIGNTAVVGLDIDSKLERSEAGIIKYTVAEAFHTDPYGIDALVTADIDLAERLREIGADIQNGRPIAGFAEEMADIIGRIIPQVPRHVAPRDEMKEKEMQQSGNPRANSTGTHPK